MVTVRRISDDDEFLQLGPRWRELEERSGPVNPFLTFEWLSSWWRSFGQGHQLCVLVVERDGALEALAPLMLLRRRAFTTLRFIGRPFSDYSDFLVAGNREERVAEILAFCDRELEWDRMELDGVLESAPNRPVFESLWRGRPGIARVSMDLVAPYVPVQEPWEKYRAGLRPKLLSDSRRQLRRLEAQGEVAFQRCDDLDTALGTLAELETQKSSRYRDTGARNIFSGGRLRTFFEDAVRALWDRGLVDVSRVVQNGSTLALHFGFRTEERFLYYMPSFDDRYRSFSVGRLLNAHLIERAFEEGPREFDFLPGDDAYKYDWTSLRRHVYSFVSYRRSLKGMALFGAQELAMGTLRGSSRVRGLVRRLRRLTAGPRR